MKLTIILTIKDRTAFTYRWMQYMNDLKCPYFILIADGGKDEEIEEHLQNAENYPNINYRYVRYPFDATIEHFYRKFEDIISKVETEYLLLADNDDFFFIESIPSLLLLLDRHKEYVGARGQLINFSISGKNGKEENVAKGEKYEAFMKETISVDQEDAIDRIEFVCSNMSRYDYYINWYCVFRSKDFAEVHRQLNSLPIREVLVNEILINVLMVARGKIHVAGEPSILRQTSTSMLGDALITENTFLERSIITNAFSEFGIAIDQFTNFHTKDEKERVLKAIAGWLGTTIYNIYTHNSKVGGIRAKFRRQIKRIPVLGETVDSLYLRLSHLWLPVSQRKKIRLPAIEPYITIKK